MELAVEEGVAPADGLEDLVDDGTFDGSDDCFAAGTLRASEAAGLPSGAVGAFALGYFDGLPSIFVDCVYINY